MLFRSSEIPCIIILKEFWDQCHFENLCVKNENLKNYCSPDFHKWILPSQLEIMIMHANPIIVPRNMENPWPCNFLYFFFQFFIVVDKHYSNKQLNWKSFVYWLCVFLRKETKSQRLITSDWSTVLVTYLPIAIILSRWCCKNAISIPNLF